MDEPIEDLYFKWLYSRVNDTKATSSRLRHYKLLEKLHETQFMFLITGDDNRVADGRDLRTEFLRELFIHNTGELMAEGCSVLEMLIAFSRRAAFETDDSPIDWFWMMLSNLGIAHINDSVVFNDRAVQDILDRFVWRTYNSNGLGGLFPLKKTKKNQRKVEVWYQFNEYLLELEYD